MTCLDQDCLDQRRQVVPAVEALVGTCLVRMPCLPHLPAAAVEALVGLCLVEQPCLPRLPAVAVEAVVEMYPAESACLVLAERAWSRYPAGLCLVVFSRYPGIPATGRQHGRDIETRKERLGVSS